MADTPNPKPARESRTLRFNRHVSWIAMSLAAIPSLVSYALDLMGDPQISAAVSNMVPAKYRAAIALIVLIVAQRNRSLRMTTEAPIAEKWIATNPPKE